MACLPPSNNSSVTGFSFGSYDRELHICVYRPNPTLQHLSLLLCVEALLDSYIYMGKEISPASSQNLSLEMSYFLRQTLGSSNEPETSKHLEIHLNVSITACLNVLPCRFQLFQWSMQGSFSWSLQCKAEHCSLESFLWKLLWILTRDELKEVSLTVKQHRELAMVHWVL